MALRHDMSFLDHFGLLQFWSEIRRRCCQQVFSHDLRFGASKWSYKNGFHPWDRRSLVTDVSPMQVQPWPSHLPQKPDRTGLDWTPWRPVNSPSADFVGSTHSAVLCSAELPEVNTSAACLPGDDHRRPGQDGADDPRSDPRALQSTQEHPTRGRVDVSSWALFWGWVVRWSLAFLHGVFSNSLRILGLSMAGVGPSMAGVRGRTKPYLFEGPDS